MRGGTLKRRLANLEQQYNRCRPKSAGQLVAEAENLVRLTGITIEAAYVRLIDSCTKGEVERMLAEVKSILSRGKKHTAVGLALNESMAGDRSGRA